MTEQRSVVFDCDTGNDDAWALLMLIRGETQPITTVVAEESVISDINFPSHRCGKYKIKAVTCVQGNTELKNVAKNTIRVLEAAGRLDIPVYKGCAHPIVPRSYERNFFFQGKDGFGDLQYENEVDTSIIQSEHAVNVMYELACRQPKKVDFILLGPLTNFAMCINMYGADFLDKIGDVYVMGGNYKGKGNVNKSAEFNFFMDPEAAYIVLDRVKSPIVILPWETCIDGNFGLTLDWRLEVLGAAPSRAIELLNKVEEAIFRPKGFTRWMVADGILAAAFLFPKLAISKCRPYYSTVELSGVHTRGQMVVEHDAEVVSNRSPNTIVLTEINVENYKNIIQWTAGLLNM